MTATVQHIAEEVSHLQGAEFGEFLTWLTDFEVSHVSEWDQQIEKDSQPGGRLNHVLDKVRTDIAAGKTKGLDEILNNT